MNERKVLQANDGKILTNGEIYGKIVYLADGVSDKVFYEITEAEYESILATKSDNNNEVI